MRQLYLGVVLLTGTLSAQIYGVKAGDIAPEIALPSPDGTIYRLSELKGYYVLLDFWASWCKPCRYKNPQIVNLYRKFQNAKFKDSKGFTVFSVSLDKNKNKWIKAIEEDGLSWKYHVSDLKFWRSEAARTYDVRGIPANALIGPDGKIIGTNLTIQEIESLLERKLEKN